MAHRIACRVFSPRNQFCSECQRLEGFKEARGGAELRIPLGEAGLLGFGPRRRRHRRRCQPCCPRGRVCRRVMGPDPPRTPWRSCEPRTRLPQGHWRFQARSEPVSFHFHHNNHVWAGRAGRRGGFVCLVVSSPLHPRTLVTWRSAASSRDTENGSLGPRSSPKVLSRSLTAAASGRVGEGRGGGRRGK